MNKVKAIWVLLSEDVVPCCNESRKIEKVSNGFISLGLFAEIMRCASEQSWTCTILCNKREIPNEYLNLCSEIDARIILPAEYEGNAFGKYTTIVFESSQIELVAKHPSVSRAILR